ncbi:MAG: superoxide dismutase family protein [Actinobacteria bacterium]|nr:superoxide dismutase family protein [Actinomycetota bacterium]
MTSSTTNRWVIGVVGTVAATLLLAASASQQPAEGRSETAKGAAQVTLYNAEGDEVGRAKLKPAGGGGTRVQARITEAAPGFHGFHIHAIGECDPDAPDGPFTTAGGHFAPEGQAHGDHAGDLPSLLVLANGTASLEFVTDRFGVRDLRDDDGSAVMIHVGRDNFANIPERYVSTTSGQPGPDEATLATGDAGARYACGVVEGG